MMDDLEMTKLCAKAMGYMPEPTTTTHDSRGNFVGIIVSSPHLVYNPLHDDAQAMALVKKLGLDISCHEQHGGWAVWLPGASGHEERSAGPDLNRAIVECVAKMQVSVRSQDNVTAK